MEVLEVVVQALPPDQEQDPEVLEIRHQQHHHKEMMEEMGRTHLALLQEVVEVVELVLQVNHNLQTLLQVYLEMEEMELVLIY